MLIRSFRNRLSKLNALFGIRDRLVLLVLILVVPLMLDRVQLLEQSRTRQIDAAANELSELARNTAKTQREIISTVEAVLKSSASIYASANEIGRGCDIMRASLRGDLPWIRSLSIVDDDGIVRCSSLPKVVGLNLKDRDYVIKARQRNAFVVSNYLISEATNAPTVMAAYPVIARGTNVPVAIAAIDLQWMSRLLNERDRPGLSAIMVDSKGTVLAAPAESADLVGKKLQNTPLFDATVYCDLAYDIADGSLSLKKDNGETRAVSYATVPGTDARIIVSMDQKIMLEDINSDIQKAYLKMVLVFILTLLGACIAAKRLIIDPIDLMTATAQKFGEGDFSKTTPSGQLPREFRPLSDAFDHMASQLGAREQEMVATNHRLTVMASIDVVSGLANRRGFESRMDFEWMKALQTDTSLALLMIDIDHFKLFNDTYGHPEGDACLANVGETIGRIAESLGGFAARYGGEEFSLLIPSCDSASAAAVGEQVRAAIEGLGIAHDKTSAKRVTVSIGVAAAKPNDPDYVYDLIEAADAALYAAKRQSRNAVVEHGRIRAAPQPPPRSKGIAA
jgi:diguanylate cyclase (GGDEF)-like protein